MQFCSFVCLYRHGDHHLKTVETAFDVKELRRHSRGRGGSIYEILRLGWWWGSGQEFFKEGVRVQVHGKSTDKHNTNKPLGGGGMTGTAWVVPGRGGLSFLKTYLFKTSPWGDPPDPLFPLFHCLAHLIIVVYTAWTLSCRRDIHFAQLLQDPPQRPNVRLELLELCSKTPVPPNKVGF